MGLRVRRREDVGNDGTVELWSAPMGDGSRVFDVVLIGDEHDVTIDCDSEASAVELFTLLSNRHSYTVN